jgi:hypothetical protein
MRGSPAPDPVRGTLLAILDQLDRAEKEPDRGAALPALELSEIEDRLSGFSPVERGDVRVALALGLLVRRGYVQARGDDEAAWRFQGASHRLYQITPEGREFLADAVRKAGHAR